MNILYKLFDGGISPVCHNGSWYDLSAANEVKYKKGSYVQIPLGVAMKLPAGCEGWLLPRSSTFKKTGLIICNGVGIIDPTYCGNDDQWYFCAYATKDGTVAKGDRICQFRTMPTMVEKECVNLILCNSLSDENRGGIGSTGGYSA